MQVTVYCAVTESFSQRVGLVLCGCCTEAQPAQAVATVERPLQAVCWWDLFDVALAARLQQCWDERNTSCTWPSRHAEVV